MKKLNRDFFCRNSVKVARELIGKYLVKKEGSSILSGKITETEAYRGINDPASHACRKKTPRNAVMFGPPGFSYVYFCYGSYFMFNVVTEPEGRAGAVLIRGVEPAGGIKKMEKNRGAINNKNFANGPGKLTGAFNITKKDNIRDLTKGNFYIGEGNKEKIRIKSSPRIGIKEGLDKNWRFYAESTEAAERAAKKSRKLRRP